MILDKHLLEPPLNDFLIPQMFYMVDVACVHMDHATMELGFVICFLFSP